MSDCGNVPGKMISVAIETQQGKCLQDVTFKATQVFQKARLRCDKRQQLAAVLTNAAVAAAAVSPIR